MKAPQRDYQGSWIYRLLQQYKYSVFVLQTKLKHPDYQPMAKESLQLAVHFLFHTYLHTKKKLRYVHTYIRSHP